MSVIGFDCHAEAELARRPSGFGGHRPRLQGRPDLGKVEVAVFPRSAIGAQPSAVELQSRAMEARNAVPFPSFSFHFWRRFETYQPVTGARTQKKFFLSPSSWTKAGPCFDDSEDELRTCRHAQPPEPLFLAVCSILASMPALARTSGSNDVNLEHIMNLSDLGREFGKRIVRLFAPAAAGRLGFCFSGRSILTAGKPRRRRLIPSRSWFAWLAERQERADCGR